MMKWMTRNMIVLAGAAALWAGLTACGPVQSQPDAQSGSTPKQTDRRGGCQCVCLY